MHHNLPDPRTTQYFDSHNQPDVTATAAGAVALAHDSNRVAFWVSLTGTISITAVQAVNIQVVENGKLVSIASISTSVPSVVLKICDLGEMIQRQITLTSPGANQTCSVGDLRRVWMREHHVDEAAGGNIPTGVGNG